MATKRQPEIEITYEIDRGVHIPAPEVEYVEQPLSPVEQLSANPADWLASVALVIVVCTIAAGMIAAAAAFAINIFGR